MSENPVGLSTLGNGRGAPKLGQRALVIGAGIGGLSAAGALAKYFDRVDIIERDDLAASAGSRSGTPQDRHPHGLLAGGLRALDQIFPGFKSDLAAAGAVPVSFAREVQFERPDVGVLPKRDFGISLLCATRPLIELVLRRRAKALANITLRPACRVIGIVPAAGGAGASGVQFVNGSGRFETLDADLVVDASGRGAPTLTLLDALCWDRPQMTEIGVDITYATAVGRDTSHCDNRVEDCADAARSAPLGIACGTGADGGRPLDHRDRRP